MKISSKDNPLIKYLSKLYSSKKERDESNQFIIEGYNQVREAKRAGVLESVYSIKEESDYPEAIIITESLLKKITDTVTPEGIIGVVHKVETALNSDYILYLDHLQDPGNLGTLLRSALAFNFLTIILDNTVDLYNPKTIRASEGAIFHLNFSHDTLEELKKEGYYLVGTSLNGMPLETTLISHKKVVLILGNEGRGVSPIILEKTDINLTIKMNEIESLNVGVAGAIIMHEINKQ